MIYGPLGGTVGPDYTNIIDRDFKTDPITWGGAAPCKPFAVPFAYFVNNTVKEADGTTTISNISTHAARMIYTGNAYFWGDVPNGNGFFENNLPIQVCFRHAGSGTHATHVHTQVRPGAELIYETLSDALPTETAPGDPSGPNILFNDGSSDQMKCVNGGTRTVGGKTFRWSGKGAIGYADADQSLTSYPNSVKINLDNITPSFDTIANGAYNWWSLQHLYGVADGDVICNWLDTNAKNVVDMNPLYVPDCAMKYGRVNACSPLLDAKSITCEVGRCANGIDDDGDGLTDLADTSDCL
jgi:hypothetical protein